MPYKDPEVRKAFQAERHQRRKLEEGFRDKRKISETKYNESEKGKIRSIMGYKSDREKHPERHKARNLLRSAIRRGNAKSQGHHEDYSKPLDVQWFCQEHHPK